MALIACWFVLVASFLRAALSAREGREVPVRELLFALARDAKVNVDVHPAIEGNVTLNAIDLQDNAAQLYGIELPAR